MGIRTQACLTLEAMLFPLNCAGSDKMQLNLDLLRGTFPNSQGTPGHSLAPTEPLRLALLSCFTPLSNWSFAHLTPSPFPSPKVSLILLCRLQSDCLGTWLQTHSPAKEPSVAPSATATVSISESGMFWPLLACPVLFSPPHEAAQHTGGPCGEWEEHRCRGKAGPSATVLLCALGQVTSPL